MKKLLMFAALAVVLCSCGSGNSKKNDTLANVHEGHEWVDLGLPSGLKWATCNVGASSPEEYGDHFAWGETRTKSTYTDDNCASLNQSWGDIGGNSSRDAATANWGGDWRMPTEAEFEELLNNCTWEWTTQNSHEGYKVTSKQNGQSIFLPAAGWRNGADKNYVGSYGSYWSSTPNASDPDHAYYLYFFEGSHGVNWDFHYYGVSVRPVLE